MITLYGHPFSRAHRVMWMLNELGLPFEHIPTSFIDGSTRAPEFLTINANGRVPVLIDDGETFVESLSINLYLAARYSGPLTPAGPVQTARAVGWSLWVATEIERALLLAAANLFLFPPEGRDSDQAALALRKLDRPFEVIDAQLARSPHLLGEDFTVADLNVASVLTLVPLAQVPIDRFPSLAAWLHRCLERPAAADWKPIRFTIPRPADPAGILAMFV